MDNYGERLQKVMASAGVASRRKCEEIILAGRVKVNGIVVTELGTKVGNKDVILVDNAPIAKQDHVYYVMNKPIGFITTVTDDKERRTVMDLFEPEALTDRIYPIGRLDYDTSGVLLFTNDGDLAYNLTKSSKNIEKVYQARIDGIITQGAVTQLIKGVLLDNIATKPAKVEIVSFDRVHSSTLIKIAITEGRNRQVRRMLETVGFPVKKLKRIAFGSITLEGLNPGEYRMLRPHEISVLKSM